MKRQLKWIPIRDSSISIAIKRGNIVLWGMEKWGDIKQEAGKIISIDEVMSEVYKYVWGRKDKDTILKRPELEYVPIAVGWNGELGKGYEYKLVWILVLQREGYNNRWEVLVDAEEKKILAFRDLNLYVKGKVIGSIYPVSSDGCCPDGCADVGAPLQIYECTPA